jgi:hypothetical protein
MAPLTLMSTDMERTVQGMQYVHEAFVSFFTLWVALWQLERLLGVGAIALSVVTVGSPLHRRTRKRNNEYSCTRPGSMLLIGASGKNIGSAQKRWVESVE